jgi:type II secretory pathway pseudopilin PulG
MLIVLGIITVILSVILTGQSSFNNSAILSNTAYDIALTLRTAQTYGTGGRSFGTQLIGYGIHVDTTQPSRFSLFADTYPAIGANDGAGMCHAGQDSQVLSAVAGDCTYESGSGEDQLISTETIGNGITISDACWYAGGWTCASASSAKTLDIVFSRPNPTPFISPGGTYDASAGVSEACLLVTSGNGSTRAIMVNINGAISITNTCS